MNINYKCLFLFGLILFLVTCDDNSKPNGEQEGGMSLAGDEVVITAGEEVIITGGDVAGNEQGGQQADYSLIKLNEIASKGVPYDWVEVINLSDEDIDLAQCTISDQLDEQDQYTLPSGVESIVPAQGFALIIVTSDSTGFGLGSEEGFYLSTPAGVLIDSVEYGREMSIEGTTYGRLPDGTGEWTLLYTETPAAPNMLGIEPVCGDGVCDITENCEADCIVCGDGLCDLGEVCDEDCQVDIELVINEVIAAGQPDGVELVNMGDEPIDLSDIYLSDDRSEPFKGSLMGVLEPNAYLWIEVSDDTLGFKLKSDEEVIISNTDGLMIDGVDWDEGDSPADNSYRRIPDIVGEFSTGASSPGEPNE